MIDPLNWGSQGRIYPSALSLGSQGRIEIAEIRIDKPRSHGRFWGAEEIERDDEEILTIIMAFIEVEHKWLD